MFPGGYAAFKLFFHIWNRSSSWIHLLYFQKNITFLQALRAACAMVKRTLLYEEYNPPTRQPEFIHSFDKLLGTLQADRLVTALMQITL